VVGSWMLLGELRRRLAVRAAVHDHEEAHTHGLEHSKAHHHDRDHEPDGADTHSHGLVPHRHVPADDAALRWRSLAMLGLAGGLIPSANALLILLGTIAAGRPGWGIVLVAAFGVGMAGVMAGLGLVVVQARSVLDRASGPASFGAARRLVPLGASLAVLAFGIVLSVEAIGAARLG
jgi:nickel/cobalt exporter